MDQAAGERQSADWSEGEDQSNSNSTRSINSEEFRNKISLSNAQLQELSKDDYKFFQAVAQNNDKAVTSILNPKPKTKQALAYLSQAQRYLEYGACCGKVIDRNLIISVLHNEAATYQRMWALDKCSKYIEAAIYNIQTSLESDYDSFSAISFSELVLKPKQAELLASVIKRKQNLVQYYLQFCAIMSQLKNHTLALSSSFKGVAMMRQLLSIYYKYYKNYAIEQRANLVSFGKKLKLLKQLSCYQQELSLQSYQHILKRTKYILKEWDKNITSQQNDNDPVKIWIKSYSIGNAMQIEPFTYQQYSQPLNFKKEFETDFMIKKVLLFAISYFTVATEIRLIESEKFPNKEEEKRKSEDFQKSELYHLTSIKIFGTYVPYESMFIKHVQHSYQNHYKPDLNNNQDVSFIADDQQQQPNVSQQRAFLPTHSDATVPTESKVDEPEPIIEEPRLPFSATYRPEPLEEPKQQHNFQIRTDTIELPRKQFIPNVRHDLQDTKKSPVAHIKYDLPSQHDPPQIKSQGIFQQVVEGELPWDEDVRHEQNRHNTDDRLDNLLKRKRNPKVQLYEEQPFKSKPYSISSEDKEQKYHNQKSKKKKIKPLKLEHIKSDTKFNHIHTTRSVAKSKKTPRGTSTQRIASPNDYQIGKPTKRKGNKSKPKKPKQNLQSDVKSPSKRLVSQTNKKKRDTERVKSNSKKDILKKDKHLDAHPQPAQNYYGSTMYMQKAQKKSRPKNSALSRRHD